MSKSMNDIYRDHVLSNANEIELSYLAHHGILGQKWGVRRFQNKDGTLTDAGKKHYTKELKKRLHKENNDYLIRGKQKQRAERHKVLDELQSELEKSEGWKKQQEATDRGDEDAFYKAHFELYGPDGDYVKIAKTYIRPYAEAMIKDLKMPNDKAIVDLVEDYVGKRGCFE